MQQRDLSGVPVFGERVAGKRYVVRACAYVVIKNDRACVAVVETPLGRFLPGGGINDDETPEEAVCREALEECGLQIRPGRRIAEATQLVHSRAEKTHFEKRSVFLNAELVAPSTSPVEVDHRLLWVAPEIASDQMAHESHAWILRNQTSRSASRDTGARTD
jgi:8-oxo-dGTP diphosphatase